MAEVIAGGLTPHDVHRRRGRSPRPRRASTAGRSPLPVHIKVDTGMHRVGRLAGGRPRTGQGRRRPTRGSPSRAVWTHFAVADEPDDPYTAEQLDALRARCSPSSPPPASTVPMRHAANSAAAIAFPASRLRPGPLRHRPVRPAAGPGWPGTSPPGARRRLGHGWPSSSRSTAASGCPTACATRRARRLVATVPIGYADGVPSAQPGRPGRCSSAAGAARSRGRSRWTRSPSTVGDDDVVPATRWCSSGARAMRRSPRGSGPTASAPSPTRSCARSAARVERRYTAWLTPVVPVGCTARPGWRPGSATVARRAPSPASGSRLHPAPARPATPSAWWSARLVRAVRSAGKVDRASACQARGFVLAAPVDLGVGEPGAARAQGRQAPGRPRRGVRARGRHRSPPCPWARRRRAVAPGSHRRRRPARRPAPPLAGSATMDQILVDCGDDDGRPLSPASRLVLLGRQAPGVHLGLRLGRPHRHHRLRDPAGSTSAPKVTCEGRMTRPLAIGACAGRWPSSRGRRRLHALRPRRRADPGRLRHAATRRRPDVRRRGPGREEDRQGDARSSAGPASCSTA